MFSRGGFWRLAPLWWRKLTSETLQINSAEYEKQKFAQLRSLMLFSGIASSFFAIALWGWDYTVDPVHASNTVEWRLMMGLGAIIGSGYLLLRLPPRWYFLSLVAGCALILVAFTKITDTLDMGHEYGAGGYIFFFFIPLIIALGIPFRQMAIMFTLFAAGPNLLYMVGISKGISLGVINAYMWPTLGICLFFAYLADILLRRLYLANSQLVAAKEQAEFAASTDLLTGLNNRRAFYELGEAAISQAERYGHALSIISLDLDHFKSINDNYGHLAGDETLKCLASLMKKTLREADIVGRLGGEEFAVILPETNVHDGVNLAERLRKEISSHVFQHNGVEIGFTSSFGLATLHKDLKSLDTLIGMADIALYEAKKKGRNRVEIAL